MEIQLELYKAIDGPRRETEPLCQGPTRDLDFGSHYERPNYKKVLDFKVEKLMGQGHYTDPSG